MDARLEEMKRQVRSGDRKQYRQNRFVDIREEPDAEQLTLMQRSVRLMRRMCEGERAVILPDERIVFTRTLPHPALPFPDWILKQTRAKAGPFGNVGNICADWGKTLSQGLWGRKSIALVSRARLAQDADAVAFLDAAIETIDATMGLVARYVGEARRLGREDLALILEQVPGNAPRTFYEALQSLRFLQAFPWMNNHDHVGLGRFDQYMWPYLKADLDTGRLSSAEAEELLAEFFITLNKDSDLYPGIQQGDNGQSLMLGGLTRDGQNAVNDLTWMVLRVSHDVNMIDPKINLRINPDTDLELLTEAARLTRRGLGFPQYSNDNVVISGLVRHGYALEDARDYTVAACWEFIIPGRGMDIPNINAVSFPAAVDQAVREGLSSHETFEDILARVQANIRTQVRTYVDDKRTVAVWPPAPFYSVLMTDCLERGKDLSQGGVQYYNFGIHGSGSSNAADALAGVKKLIYAERTVSSQQLVDALGTNFEMDEPLRQKLLTDIPRVGNNDDVDEILTKLFDWFADACEEIEDNGRGGIVRPGTGSAMYYVWLVKHVGVDMLEPGVGATADGRRIGDYISSSLAPSPGVQVRGPISVLQSFSKIDYQRVCNGGPITMELSDSVFRDEEALHKVAMLVRTFARLGCQQLQLNVLSAETLKDAKLHPENHMNLIVRVWGWSGYFCELAPEYQDHIIARHMHSLS